MKYRQMKAWPTRRLHLFEYGQSVSICGLVMAVQCFAHKDNVLWHHHRYDDLNYCQSCRRTAMKFHGKKYVPLSTIYQNPNPDAEGKKDASDA